MLGPTGRERRGGIVSVARGKRGGGRPTQGRGGRAGPHPNMSRAHVGRIVLKERLDVDLVVSAHKAVCDHGLHLHQRTEVGGHRTCTAGGASVLVSVVLVFCGQVVLRAPPRPSCVPCFIVGGQLFSPPLLLCRKGKRGKEGARLHLQQIDQEGHHLVVSTLPVNVVPVDVRSVKEVCAARLPRDAPPADARRIRSGSQDSGNPWDLLPLLPLLAAARP